MVSAFITVHSFLPWRNSLLTASMASKQPGQVDIGQLPIPQLNQLVQQLEQVKSPCLFFIQRYQAKFCRRSEINRIYYVVTYFNSLRSLYKQIFCSLFKKRLEAKYWNREIYWTSIIWHEIWKQILNRSGPNAQIAFGHISNEARCYNILLNLLIFEDRRYYRILSAVLFSREKKKFDL